MRNLFFAILAAALSLWLLSAASAQTLTLSLANAYPSQTVTVTGASFGAKEAVDIYFQTADTLLLVSGGAGAFSAAVTVPVTQQPGTAYITAIGRHSGFAAQAALNITTPWTEMGYGAGHHSRNPYENTLGVQNVATLGPSWSNSVAGGGSGATPAISTGRVIVSTLSNVAVALARTTGAVLWTGPAGTSLSSAVIFNGSVYATDSSAGIVYDLNLTTGAVIWSTTLGGTIFGSPLISNGVVYIGLSGGAGGFYALNASTGAQVWSFTGGLVNGSAAVVNGIVYFGSSNYKIYALNAVTGATIWTYTTGSAVQSTPAVANNVVYIGSNDKKIYALNAVTGALRWTYLTQGFVYSSPAYSQYVLYIGSDDGNFYALNALTGSPVWSLTTGGAVRSAAVANGVIYFTDTQTFYAVSAASGTILNYFASGSTYFGGPSVSDGLVYLNTYESSVYALSANGGTGPKPPSSSPPPLGTLFPDRSLKVSF